MHVGQVVGGKGPSPSVKREAAVDANAATRRLREGSLALRGPASFDTQDPACASDALGHLVAGLRARPGIPSEEGAPPSNAFPLAEPAGQGLARLRLPRLLGGHAEAAPLVIAEGLLNAGPVPKVRLGSPVGAVGPPREDGRALGSPCETA